MSKIVLPKQIPDAFQLIKDNALLEKLQKDGRFPPVSVSVTPLGAGREPFYSTKFLSYNFSSNILVPVDTFSFSLAMDEFDLFDIPVQEGDLITLRANAQLLSTGIVDTVEVETDAQTGTKIHVSGRDLMSQLEDQDAVSLTSEIIFGKTLTVSAAVNKLIENTRIQGVTTRNAPTKGYLLATQPGETKLSALQRYMEPLNILAWMGPGGSIIIGKPDMYAQATGRLFMSRKRRESNVLSIRSTRSSTSIPNAIVAIWNSQANIQSKVSKEQVLYNKNKGPLRLYQKGHIVPRAVIVSNPDGNSPQDLSQVNDINIANQQKAGSSNLLQAYAKREMARANIKELQVQIQMLGHYNHMAEPFMPDKVYNVEYDIDNLNEDMYLYGVEYTFSEDQGQRTNLFLCRQNCIVADYKVV